MTNSPIVNSATLARRWISSRIWESLGLRYIVAANLSYDIPRDACAPVYNAARHMRVIDKRSFDYVRVYERAGNLVGGDSAGTPRVTKLSFLHMHKQRWRNAACKPESASYSFCTRSVTQHYAISGNAGYFASTILTKQVTKTLFSIHICLLFIVYGKRLKI